MGTKNANGWDDIREYAEDIMSCIDKFVFSEHATTEDRQTLDELREYAETIAVETYKSEMHLYSNLLCMCDIASQVFESLLTSCNENEYEEYEEMYDALQDYPEMTYDARDKWVLVADKAPTKFRRHIDEATASSHFCNPGS